MPKDPQKYHYITIGLLRGSWALSRFLEDAERHHILDQPGKLAALRLTEYYEAVERGHLISTALTVGPAPILQESRNGVTDGQISGTIAPARQSGPSHHTGLTPEQPSLADAKADAALDYFLMDNEKEED